MQDDIALLRAHTAANCRRMLHAPTDLLPHPFLVPGSVYSHVLWDWDSWLCSVALLQALHEPECSVGREELLEHMRGCVLNFLHHQADDGYLPICIEPWLLREGERKRAEGDEVNQAKPVLAQFAALISRETGGAGWLGVQGLEALARFHAHYDALYKHSATGLYFWRSDLAIGVDNEPAVFGRPRNSAATIYLNALMLRELEAGAWLAGELGLGGLRAAYAEKRTALLAAARRWLWDARDGFYYNADLQCKLEPVIPGLHKNQPEMWPCLPVRVLGWTGFLALWAGIAAPEQAERMVRAHLLNPDEFASLGGVRSLAANEPMYNLAASGNPSNWLGPIWIIANYMTWRGLRRLGFTAEADDIYRKTVRLLAADVRASGAMHEYYAPETAQPIINPGFMNWNYLVLNMMAASEGDRPAVTEWEP